MAKSLQEIHPTETENIIPRSEDDHPDNRDMRANLLTALKNFKKEKDVPLEKPSHITYKHSNPEWITDTSIYGKKQQYWRAFPDPKYKLSGYLENWNKNPNLGTWLALGINNSGYCYVGQHTDIQEAIYQMIQFEEQMKFERRQSSIEILGYTPL